MKSLKTGMHTRNNILCCTHFAEERNNIKQLHNRFGQQKAMKQLLNILNRKTGRPDKWERFVKALHQAGLHMEINWLKDYCKHGNFRVGVIFAFFALNPLRENYTHAKIKPICLNKGNRSSIVKITPAWNVLPTFSQNFPPSENNHVYSIMVHF